MPFDVPMIRKKSANHVADCNFCLIPPVSGTITKKKKWSVKYPIPCALRPVSHGKASDRILLAVQTREKAICSRPRACGGSKDEFSCFDETFAPHKLTSEELNDLIRDSIRLKAKRKYWSQDFDTLICSKI
ncbi:hypothetical protein Trydic_g797 [Trypoxylus dichotomus]